MAFVSYRSTTFITPFYCPCWWSIWKVCKVQISFIFYTLKTFTAFLETHFADCKKQMNTATKHFKRNNFYAFLSRISPIIKLANTDNEELLLQIKVAVYNNHGSGVPATHNWCQSVLLFTSKLSFSWTYLHLCCFLTIQLQCIILMSFIVFQRNIFVPKNTRQDALPHATHLVLLCHISKNLWQKTFFSFLL